MKQKTTFAERVSWGLRRIGSNSLRAAKALGWSHSMISKIVAGEVKNISFPRGIKLANYLHMCPVYLATGETKSRISIVKGAEQRDISDNPKFPLIMRHIPILTWQEAGNLTIRSASDIPDRSDRDYIGDLSSTGLNNFAVKMEGNSMLAPGKAESFRDGEFLYFDPTQDAYIGCYVLARDKALREAYFRLLSLDCGQPCLVPHNSAFPVIKITGNIEINGVLVDAHRRFNHVPEKAKKKVKYLAEILKKSD
jgi:SOS-response transcriptional repressor LexA